MGEAYDLGGLTAVSSRALVAALDLLDSIQIATSKIRSKLMRSVFFGCKDSTCLRKRSSWKQW
jgi:hypothetical protein